jgi:exopolysaccharide biosynthesis polyprenyl glycosylphosphotransferase
MVRAWTFRSPSSRALLLAPGVAPPLALGALYVVSTQGAVFYSERQLLGLVLVVLVLEACFGWMRLGRFLVERDWRPLISRTVKASAAGAVIAWGTFRLMPELSPGYGGALAVGGGSAALLLAVRALLPRLVAPRDLLDGVLILGRRDLAAKLCLDLLDGAGGVERAARVAELGLPGREKRDAALDAAELRRLVAAEGISHILVVEPDAEARKQMNPALLECRLLGVRVEDAVEFYQRRHGKLWLEALDPGRLVFADGFRITPVYVKVKRGIDVLCALLLLVLAAPVMALVALLVKLESPGPVLYRQERVGQFGRTFQLLKFRSMRADAEVASGPAWARENDDRVTRIGRILRRFHLDELPQAWNALTGDLSFVGPRPERPCFVELLRERIPFYDLRHFVKPGITGWAQVRGPYASSIEDSYEKLEYDLAYAKNLSLGLDLEILARTAWKLLRGSGR